MGMYSADGEYVPWFSEVSCTGPVEIWFGNIGDSFLTERNTK